MKILKFIAHHYCLNGYLNLVVVYEFVHELVNRCTWFNLELPTSDKYNLDKITAKCVWRSLERVQTGLGSLGKSIWFKLTIEVHDNDKSSRSNGTTMQMDIKFNLQVSGI